MQKSYFGIKPLGSKIDPKLFSERLNILKKEINNFIFYLVIAGTETSQIEGISAAGVNSKARMQTALADAEFLLFGACADYKYKLPFLNAGVTPALISYVCSKLICASPIVVPIGIKEKPYFSHLVVENYLEGPAKCLTTGKSMNKNRVLKLYKKGLEIGKSAKQPIFILESVPGGTTTAQAVMEAFGLNVNNLIGSSLINAPRTLKTKVIKTGLLNANLKNNFDSLDVISSVGDPFQAFSMGLLIGARLAKQSVVLSGGSQMLAVILLALEFIDSKEKQEFTDFVFVATTGWLVKDNSLSDLLDLINEKHNVKLIGLASPLNFKSSKFKELSDYEIGYVKEGVGAGGLSILASLMGFNNEEIVTRCQINLERMKKFCQISLDEDY
ncbi:nicotinate-nucleotide--dimethylbenzimidazole phosphoribosyltransferase [Prochlorococcus sp. AH-716-E13]|nr:nicotinate-nucleotide--dimethylbenzimidazole phosphoribosyltransferase [Prochlorococcus sp. AH-716-E13]